WRGKHRTEPLALDHTENYGVDAPCTAETYERQLLVEQALASVSERSQRVLRMHYMEGYSAREIAETLATSTRYAEKMIHVAMRDVRSAYKGFESHD
ncbi:MAG: sigma factor-like helix-turn-helix DNA-binding protein, partial [Acidobacteriota bacterium]